MVYSANGNRYKEMKYFRCGRSGIMLPGISLGLWHNFGGVDVYERSREMVLKAFDLGITHFDLANNYGPPPGTAEETFGKIMAQDLKPYRDELLISTKAGYYMWEGPYGDWGSRKYLVSSLDQSLKRMGLDYVDIFYHHRPDPNTPLEETMTALDHLVRQGKALYVGISNYNAEQTEAAVNILKELGTPLLIHQMSYSMFRREPEASLLPYLQQEGIGSIAFSPLAQGLLTNKYLDGIPSGSRASKPHGFLKEKDVSEDKLAKVRALNELAMERGQSLAQMSLAWALRNHTVTSVLIGASSAAQIAENAKALDNLEFSEEELQRIEAILQSDAK